MTTPSRITLASCTTVNFTRKRLNPQLMPRFPADVACFSGNTLELPSDNHDVYALLLAMTPHGILLANDFRLIRSLVLSRLLLAPVLQSCLIQADSGSQSEAMMKTVDERYRTNANFVARFPDQPFVKYANSIKIATHYSKLLAPGLHRHEDSCNEYLGVSPFHLQTRRSDTLPGIAADLCSSGLQQSKTWSLSSRSRRKTSSAFAPVSRLSI